MGCAKGWQSPGTLAAGAAKKEAFRSATPLQKMIISDIWDRHALRAEWGTINDGRAVLSRLTGSVGSGYSSVTMEAEATTKTSSYKKGDLCPLVSEQVSLPNPGTRQLHVRDLATSAWHYIEHAKSLMIRGSGEVDWERYENTKRATPTRPSETRRPG